LKAEVNKKAQLWLRNPRDVRDSIPNSLRRNW